MARGAATAKEEAGMGRDNLEEATAKAAVPMVKAEEVTAAAIIRHHRNAHPHRQGMEKGAAAMAKVEEVEVGEEATAAAIILRHPNARPHRQDIRSHQPVTRLHFPFQDRLGVAGKTIPKTCKPFRQP
jgi:hypothetical protein